jgi:hypothetical protein
MDFVDPADGNDVLSSVSRIPHNLIENGETMTRHDLRLLHLMTEQKLPFILGHSWHYNK